MFVCQAGSTPCKTAEIVGVCCSGGAVGRRFNVMFGVEIPCRWEVW